MNIRETADFFEGGRRSSLSSGINMAANMILHNGYGLYKALICAQKENN